MKIKFRKDVTYLSKKKNISLKSLNRSVKSLSKKGKAKLAQAAGATKTAEQSKEMAELEYLLLHLENAEKGYSTLSSGAKSAGKAAVKVTRGTMNFVRFARGREPLTDGRLGRLKKAKPTRFAGRRLRSAAKAFKLKGLDVAKTTAGDSDIAQQFGTAAEICAAKSVANIVSLVASKVAAVVKTVATKVAVLVAKKTAALISAATGVAMSTLAVIGVVLVAIIAVATFMLNARAEAEAKSIRYMSPGGKAWQAVMDSYRDYVTEIINDPANAHDSLVMSGLTDGKLPVDSNFAQVAVGIYRYSSGLFDLRTIGEQLASRTDSGIASIYQGLYKHFNAVKADVIEKDGKKVLQLTCDSVMGDGINNASIAVAMKIIAPGIMDEPLPDAGINTLVKQFDDWVLGRGDVSEAGIAEYAAALERQMQPMLMVGNLSYPFSDRHYIDDYFGWRILNGKGNYHNGIDFPAAEGTPIISVTGGYAVMLSGGTLGNYVAVDTEINGTYYRLVYGHMSAFAGVAGEIMPGTVIGYVGNTGYSFGAHLHLGVWVGNSSVDPLTIFPWLDE